MVGSYLTLVFGYLQLARDMEQHQPLGFLGVMQTLSVFNTEHEKSSHPDRVPQPEHSGKRKQKTKLRQTGSEGLLYLFTGDTTIFRKA